MHRWSIFRFCLKTTYRIFASVIYRCSKGIAYSKPLFIIGNYQIKQAKGYIVEHLKPSILDNDTFEFTVELSSKYKDLVRVRFASRHSNHKNYVATVQFDDQNDEEPITGWYCTCSAGARVIGCCAHITALLWHIGVCRGQVNTPQHSLSANNYLSSVEDCIQYSDIDPSDDEDVSSSETDSDED